MKRMCLVIVTSLLLDGGILAQKPPLLPEKEVRELANELSGETAKRNLEVIATSHRQRVSQGFHAAAELVAERVRAYGLSNVEIFEFPADGKIFYGTQRSRPAWDAEMGELSELMVVEETLGDPRFPRKAFGVGKKTIASNETEPIVLAEDSESADVTAELVNVGEGTKEGEYAGKDGKGKRVLVSADAGAVHG